MLGLAGLSAVAIIGVSACAAQIREGDGPADTSPAASVSGRSSVVVDQIGPSIPDRAVGVTGQAASGRPPPGMTQLPPDLVVEDDRKEPEKSIGETRPLTRKEELYKQVAEIWYVLRMRGQQPTPELIAREIGPDNLTNFLNTFPGSENIFGADSDRLPLPDPSGSAPPGSDPNLRPDRPSGGE